MQQELNEIFVVMFQNVNDIVIISNSESSNMAYTTKYFIVLLW